MAAAREKLLPLAVATRLSGSLELAARKSTTVNQSQAIINEAVKMHGTVLVQLRHKDIFQAIAAHTVIKPCVELFHNGVNIVSVHFGSIQSEGNKVREFIA